MRKVLKRFDFFLTEVLARTLKSKTFSTGVSIEDYRKNAARARKVKVSNERMKDQVKVKVSNERIK